MARKASGDFYSNEADQIGGDMLARMHGFGIAVPVLTAAYTHLPIHSAPRHEGAPYGANP
jgi:hypothetical protein